VQLGHISRSAPGWRRLRSPQSNRVPAAADLRAVGGYFELLAVCLGVSAFLTAPVARLLAMPFGFLAGLIGLRTRRLAFIGFTIALLLVVKIIFDNWVLLGGQVG
jgi:ABC-type branched-subunit amino acid transport system permease subunit